MKRENPTCWIKKNYSRILIDNHITECDERLLSNYSPENYASMIADAGFSSAMVYACDHNGNCYYPTKVGHMHKNIKGRDLFGEVVANLKKRNVIPVAYTTVVFHNDSAKKHPSWRMEDANGNQHDGRYWYSCFSNKEYVAFSLEQLRELLVYDVAGIFIDMTFWPMICTCRNCRERYRKETGKDIPPVIDWTSPEWVGFQRSRERWLVEYCNRLSGLVHSEFPGKTVTLQNAPILQGWTLGQTRGVSAACDYASGDFYGGKSEHRFGTKVLSAHSKQIPFEFMTSRCIHLFYHTTTKGKAEMVMGAMTTLAHGGAYMLIDAINPDGTLEPRVYSLLREVTQTVAPYEQLIQRENPALEADVGIYFPMLSFIDPKMSGRDVKEARERCTHMAGISKAPVITEMTGTSRLLNKLHIPHTVVPDDTEDLDRFKTIFINNAPYLSEAECVRLRNFVKTGGTLIATGQTSLYSPQGTATGNFALADVFGVNFTGSMSDSISYLHDEATGEKYVATAACPLVKASTADSLAKITSPMYPPFHPELYASIHSNPWGEVTDLDAITVNSFCKGKCIYLAQELLGYSHDDHTDYLKALLKDRINTAYKIETNAPPCVEVTVLKSTQSDKRILALVNRQDELPGIPIHGIEFSITLPGGRIKEVASCNGSNVIVKKEDGKLSLQIPVLGDAEFFEIVY